MVTKSKYDFISELLNKKKLSSDQKNRIQELIILELKKSDLNYDDLSRRVDLIEKQLIGSNKVSTNKVISSHKLPEEQKPQQKKYPEDTYKFLFEYNQDEILKYTCHKIDQEGLNTINRLCNTEEYDYEKHHKIIQESFKKLAYRLSIKKDIYVCINSYISGEDRWSKDKININWACEELKSWIAENPRNVPCPDDDILPTHQKFELSRPFTTEVIQKKRITNFNDVVIHFKNLFHLRPGRGTSTKDLLDSVNNRILKNNQCEFIYSNNFDNTIELFTYTERLIDIYENIILGTIEGFNKKGLDTIPKFEISYGKNEKEKFKFLKIHNLNSKYFKHPDDALRRAGKKTRNILYYANGNCYVYLKAKFENNRSAEINMYDKNDPKIKYIKDFSGVEFKLVFPI